MSATLHWLILSASPADLDAWSRQNLAPAEREHLAVMRFEPRRRSYLLGRCAAKDLLTRAEPALAGIPPVGYAILNQPDGAPYVEVAAGGRLPGCLSLSHRDDVAACAWHAVPDLRHGIDLERVEPRHPAFAADYLTPPELTFAGNLPEPLRSVWVTLAWSAREAALKALGAGLRLDTRRLAVNPPDPAALATDAGWQPLRVAIADEQPTVMTGWWQRRGDFMLTLITSTSASEVTLVEHTPSTL